jgi:hypothetical protein
MYKNKILSIVALSIALFLVQLLPIKAGFSDCPFFNNLIAAVAGGNVFRDLDTGDTIVIKNSATGPFVAGQLPLVLVTINGQAYPALEVNDTLEFRASSRGTYQFFIQADNEDPSTVFNTPFTMECIPAEAANATNGSGLILPPDERLNWRYGDAHICIAYENSAGNLDIYVYSEAQYYSNVVTEEDMAAYLDNPPATNVLLWQEGNVAVYAASTSGLVMVCGPDSEGKEYRWYIPDFDKLRVGYGTYFDPNE